MRLSISSSTLLATILLSVPQLGSALEAKLAGVVDWHQPRVGIPLVHRLEAAPSFVALPSSSSNSSTSVVTITKSNVLASLDPSTGEISQYLLRLPPRPERGELAPARAHVHHSSYPYM
jgi:hypothetical protein